MSPTVRGHTPFDALLESACARPGGPPTDHGSFALLVAQASGVLVTSGPPLPQTDDRLRDLLDLLRT